MMLLLVVAGGAIWMPDQGRTTTVTAEGLVVAYAPNNCVPATGTFGGVSTTDSTGKLQPVISLIASIFPVRRTDGTMM
jgi:hypothetical protein